jgi:hypothetical protein
MTGSATRSIPPSATPAAASRRHDALLELLASRDGQRVYLGGPGVSMSGEDALAIAGEVDVRALLLG